MKPFFAVYSTFLQRAFDNVLHDAALQRLPVRLCIDRASLATGDGPTHHGIFDVAFLSEIPNVTIYAPVTFRSVVRMMHEMASDTLDGPVAMRYPNAPENAELARVFYPGGVDGDSGYTAPVRADFSARCHPDAVFIGYGSIMSEALRAEAILRRQNVRAASLLIERLKPYDDVADMIVKMLPAGVRCVVFLEEGIACGGASMILADRLRDVFDARGIICRIHAIADQFIKPDVPTDLLSYCHLRGEDIAGTVMSVMSSSTGLIHKNINKRKASK